MTALFGWQGLAFQHPEDWAPVVFSGDRNAGYIRVASPRALSLQLRWAPSGRETLPHALGRYLDRLSLDARRRKETFSREVEEEGNLLRYRYRGATNGDGILFPTEDGRVAFLEALGDSTTARRKALEFAEGSFLSGLLPEAWSVHGLKIALPKPLRVDAKEFLSGKTALKLSGKGVSLEAERWGMAESLLAKSSLAEWAGNRLGNGWKIEEQPQGLVAERRSRFLPESAMAILQPDKNQITLLRVKSRSEAWRPQWDWLT